MERSRDTGKSARGGKRLGYVGLGKMGFNMVERLAEKGYRTVVFDINKDAIERAAAIPSEPASDIVSLVRVLRKPRLIWLMLPHEAVDPFLKELSPLLDRGDTIIDGGNSYYKDSIRHADELALKGIEFLDAGVSGGPAGARNGACIMVGGKKDHFDRYEHLFCDLSLKDGYGYMGGPGAGHFVKMIHNGIEYGMMQALAEGFAVMKASPFNLDLKGVADLFNHGSVITSRLVGWMKDAFDKYGQDLGVISGSAAQSGEGLWTIEAGKEFGVPTPIIEGSVNFRTVSKARPSYAGQIISALRNQFGRHDVFKS